jgi:proline-rich tail region repeat protein
MSVRRTYKRTTVKGTLIPTVTRVPPTAPAKDTYKTVLVPSLPGNIGNIPKKGPGAIFLTLDDLTLDQLENLTLENLDLLLL